MREGVGKCRFYGIIKQQIPRKFSKVRVIEFSSRKNEQKIFSLFSLLVQGCKNISCIFFYIEHFIIFFEWVQKKEGEKKSPVTTAIIVNHHHCHNTGRNKDKRERETKPLTFKDGFM